MENLYEKCLHQNNEKTYHGYKDDISKIDFDIRYWASYYADLEDELSAFQEFKYFLKVVFPHIIEDFVTDYVPRKGDPLRKATSVRIKGTKCIYSHFASKRFKTEGEKSPLSIYIGDKMYFMPYALTKVASARFCIYLSKFLQDYNIGYIYNNNGITLGNTDDIKYETIFEGAHDANIFLRSSIGNCLNAYYLELERIESYEKEAMGSDCVVLDLMASDTLKGRKLKK